MGRKTLMLIDFNNVLYAHYYTKPLTNTKGQEIHAIKGFLYRLKNLREIFNPDYIVIARDLGRATTFRRELYPEYKGTRKPTENSMVFQVNTTARLLALMGYPVIGNERYEADDIIGMCSKLAEELNMDVIIVSADKDLYQLISPSVKIWSFKVNEIIDQRYMMDCYGLTPSQWVDLKILQGDRSDNIPGIPGIGTKTAMELMRGFGSIQGIYNNIQKLSNSIQEKLKDNKDSIPLTRRLVTIVRDYKLLGITEKDFERKEVFRNEVYNEIAELEIHSVVNLIQYDLLPIVYNTDR